MTRRFTGIDMAQYFVEEGWRSWRDAVKGAAENTIGPRKKEHRPWISKTTKSLVLERQKAKVDALPIYLGYLSSTVYLFTNICIITE